MEDSIIAEPTSDECNAHAKLTRLIDGVSTTCFAAWYPQMGGYSGKCLIAPLAGEENVCFEVFVWHDGEFPFQGEGEFQPRRLHHCLAGQFITFGRFAQSVSEPQPEGGYIFVGEEGREIRDALIQAGEIPPPDSA